MTGFTWVKKTKHWKDWFGMGFWTRQGSENMLIAVKGKDYPRRASASVRNVVRARSEVHSRKPHVFREKIDELMGAEGIVKAELFARTRVDGWDVFGDELENVHVDLSPTLEHNI